MSVWRPVRISLVLWLAGVAQIGFVAAQTPAGAVLSGRPGRLLEGPRDAAPSLRLERLPRARAGLSLQKPRTSRLDSKLDRIASEVAASLSSAFMLDARLDGVAPVPVTIRLAGISPALIKVMIERRGGRAVRARGDVIEAYVPAGALRAIAEQPAVLSVRRILPPVPLVTSSGTIVHNSPEWNSSGFTGAGIKVGIIDVGFRGYSALAGTELPAAVHARCYTRPGEFTSNPAHCETSTSHGTAVAEAVVDTAPGVSLYIANPLSFGDLQDTVTWMAAEGVHVVNHSVGWIWTGPGDGTSIYADAPLTAVDAAVRAGIVWVNAAGNHALASWSGPFVDVDGNGLLEYSAGGAEVNSVHLRAGETLIAQARWDDTWGAAARDLDLYLLNGSLSVVEASLDVQQGAPGAVPFEALAYTAPVSGTYHLVIHRSAGTPPPWVQLQAFTGQTLGTRVAAYSIANPAESANPGLLATGAAPWHSTSTIEPFSSRGPTRDQRMKPDLVGADGGNSATLGVWYGTSQAAPHVAGLAALVRQAMPGLAPGQVAAYLKTHADPRSAPVPNNVWGHGFAVLPAPVPIEQSTTIEPGGPTLPAEWKALFGLDALADSGGDRPDADPDGDGMTNWEEYQAGTHPLGFYSRYLAEGATSTFFDVSLAVANPSRTLPARTLLRFLQSDGSIARHFVVVPPLTRYTLDAKTVPGLGTAAFSTVVESDTDVVVERTMTWDARGYGSHAEAAASSPASTWYLAEGATHPGFNLFYLLQNPHPVPVTVEVRYLRPAPAPPVLASYAVAPHSRFNIWVNQVFGLASTAVSAVITAPADRPILVERAMYLDTPGHPFGAGHASLGVTAPSTEWFFAEGATGPFFDMFILIANPGHDAAQIQARYLLPDGTVVTKPYVIAPESRFNIWVDQEDRALANTAVSVILESINGVPVVAERSMWWPNPGWHEAHNSAGATKRGPRWVVAGGESGGPRRAETYVLIANTSAHPASIRLTLFDEQSSRTESLFTIAPHSRFSVPVGGGTETAAYRFGALIESLGANPADLVVERATYSDAEGVTWAAGSNVLGTRLP
jgi:subtilisin family serine protease